MERQNTALAARTSFQREGWGTRYHRQTNSAINGKKPRDVTENISCPPLCTVLSGDVASFFGNRIIEQAAYILARRAAGGHRGERPAERFCPLPVQVVHI